MLDMKLLTFCLDLDQKWKKCLRDGIRVGTKRRVSVPQIPCNQLTSFLDMEYFCFCAGGDNVTFGPHVMLTKNHNEA